VFLDVELIPFESLFARSVVVAHPIGSPAEESALRVSETLQKIVSERRDDIRLREQT
jgi:hypothetical protein